MAEPIVEETGPDGVAVWRFDLPGEKVNTLGLAVLGRLEALIGKAKANPPKGILITSAKEGSFLAGADLEEMRAILASPDAAARMREASALGHRVFSALEALPCPTVAVIHGTCLGGGTELALACRWRLAVDDPALRIGLPEVKLGILPAWGGCVRLPRKVGLTQALGMILPGKELRASQALKIGLVDGLIPAQAPEDSARKFLADPHPRVPKRGLVQALLDGPLSTLALSQAEKQTRRKTGGHYPAPMKAIEAIRAGTFEAEEAAVSELVSTPVAKHLVGLFFLTQENRKYSAGIDARPREVETLGVLGAGLMGAGIAQVAAEKGLKVRMKDVSPEALAKGYQRIAGGLRRPEAMARIAGGTTWEGFSRVDLIVEAVVEKLEVKRAVLAEFQAANACGIFASNTSTLPITSIAEGSKDPARVVGMHFFNPVPKMPLVEVIPGRETSPEVTATTLALAKRLGKFVVVVKDSPGFLVNRILAPYLNEALRCLEEGVPPEDLDAAMKTFGMPMGPVELLGQVGIPVARHAGEVLAKAFPERLAAPALLGKLGHDLSGLPAFLPPPSSGWTPEGVQERLVLAMVNEAAWALSEGVVATAKEVDLAMVFGTGFAPFRGGLLHHADALGAGACVEALKRRGVEPCPLLADMARSGRAFHGV